MKRIVTLVFCAVSFAFFSGCELEVDALYCDAFTPCPPELVCDFYENICVDPY